MKEKKKLSSEDEIAYLKSDKESWESSHNYFMYFITNKYSKKVITISVYYPYSNIPLRKNIEKKVKEILSGLSFYPVKKK